MASVAQLCEPYGNFLLAPRPGPGVCPTCFNLTDRPGRCRACRASGEDLDALLPISYSVGGGQLHHALASYKRGPAHWYEPFSHQLAAVLWLFLAAHEPCLARAVGVERFAVVTTPPSGDPLRDDTHPLHQLIGGVVEPTRNRHRRLLRRTSRSSAPHRYAPDTVTCRETLHDEAVLVVDDMWTTGATVQATATALKRAGAGPVAAVVIGRHLNAEWHDNAERLMRLPTPYDWGHCSLCQTALY